MASKTEFAVGQVWLSPKGLAYTIEAQEEAGWRVSIRRYAGKAIGEVTASAKPWYFTDEQLNHQAQTKEFRLYNEKAVARLDDLANILEQKGKTALAAALDAISQEYTEGMIPKRVRQVRVQRAAQQLETLKREIKDAKDPEVIRELAEKIKEKTRIIETDGPRVQPANPIAPPPAATEPLKSAEPMFVSKR